MKFKKEWLKNRWVENTIAICIGVVLFVLLENLGGVFGWIGKFFRFITPVIVGLAIAYVIDPLARLFEHHLFGKLKSWQLRRMLAVILALVLIFALVVLLMVYLVPQLVDSVTQFVNNLDSYSASLKKWIQDFGGKFEKFPINPAKVNDFLDNIVNNLVKWVGDNKEVILNKGFEFGNGLLTFILGLILAIYFLFGKYFLVAGGKRFLRASMSQEKYKGTMQFFSRCNAIMTRYVAFDVLDGIIIGVLNAIFMAIMGMPYIVLISVVVGVTNLAPTFGPLVGAVIGAFILVLVNPLDALIFLIFTLALQTVDGYILKPKLFGDSLGVSSVVILVFIILGGRMFGILGVLLSIPLAAIVDFSYHDYILARMERKRGIKDGDEETPEAESEKSRQQLTAREQERGEKIEEWKEARKLEKEQERQEKEQEKQEKEARKIEKEHEKEAKKQEKSQGRNPKSDVNDEKDDK